MAAKLISSPTEEELKAALNPIDGQLLPFDHELACKDCHTPFRYKSNLKRHYTTCQRSMCKYLTNWHKAENHTHKLICVAFYHEEDLKKYIEETLQVPSFYVNPVGKSTEADVAESKEAKGLLIRRYECWRKKEFKCHASLAIRKNTRFISEGKLLPVLEIVGCMEHTHEMKPLQILSTQCQIDHDHIIIDEFFSTRDEAEARIAEIREDFTWKKKQRYEEGYRLTCKSGDMTLKLKCTAILVLKHWKRGVKKYQLSGCVRHTHTDYEALTTSDMVFSNRKKGDLLCPSIHAHEIVDLSFSTNEELLQYLEDTELESQFAVRHTHLNKGGIKSCDYFCAQSKKLNVGYERKKKTEERYDCNAHFKILHYTSKTTFDLKKPYRIFGCITHDHPDKKARFSIKFRKEINRKLGEVGVSGQQQERLWKRFVALVCKLKKRHGRGFLDEFTAEDVVITEDVITFKDELLERYPEACNARLTGKSKSPIIQKRRESKREKLLLALAELQRKALDMELNDQGEDFIDASLAAVRKLNETRPCDDVSQSSSSVPLPVKRKLGLGSNPSTPRRKKIRKNTPSKKLMAVEQKIEVDHSFAITDDQHEYHIQVVPSTSNTPEFWVQPL